jgi:hypothetical protein
MVTNGGTDINVCQQEAVQGCSIIICGEYGVEKARFLKCYHKDMFEIQGLWGTE